MRIAFVCGSLQEGSNGVGDHVLRLARVLQMRGIDCKCIALSDMHVDSTLESTFIDRYGDQIPCTRISSQDSWSIKQSFLQQSLDSFKPNWISLHYVPYAFHNKGLPHRLRDCLCSLDVAAQWHVMVHELWVDPWHRLSNLLLNPVQKLLLKDLIVSLDAKTIHTSNDYYRMMLGCVGINASILPNFSNIIFNAEVNGGLSYPGWRFVLFGGILPDWDPRPLMRAILDIAQQQSIPGIEFLSIGNIGAHGALLWNRLDSLAPPGVSYKMLGPLDPPDISYWLQNSDFGITTSPSHLLGKSSSVAAMVEHGLPVIVSRLEKTNGPWHQILKSDQRFILLDDDFGDSLALDHKLLVKDQLSATADLFLLSLSGDR